MLGVDVVASKVGDRVAGQHVALAVVAVRRRHCAHVGRGVDQQLQLERDGLCGIAPGQRDHSGQVATGAVATHGKTPGVQAQLSRVGLQPAGGRQHVVHRRWEPVLRAHAVVHRHHRALRGIRQITAQTVVGVQVAHDPTTAVVIHQRGGRAGSAGRAVQTQRDGAVWACGRQITHLGNRPRRRLGDGTAVQVKTAGILRCQRVGGRHLAGCHQVKQRLGLWVEHLVSWGCSGCGFVLLPAWWVCRVQCSGGPARCGIISGHARSSQTRRCALPLWLAGPPASLLRPLAGRPLALASA